MVVVSISETYDLHTEVNKLTLIGVHSPTSNLVKKLYPGFCMNYRYMKILGVDVTLSTAQQLPLGVDQIGLDTGQIRPQDMMNPILYKAVSNDSWSTLEARLNGLRQQGALTGDMADVENSDVAKLTDEHGVYYALLSNRDGWRVAHPQNGLSMKKLRPFVFEELTNHAVQFNNGNGQEYGIALREKSDSSALERYPEYVEKMRGRARPMPRVNTTYLTGYPTSFTSLPSEVSKPNGMGDGTPWNLQSETPTLPACMLGAIVLPPVSATTGILYYRMVCRCYIEFTEARPISEITSFASMNSIVAPLVYHTDYDEQSKFMSATTNMADIQNGDIEKIMDGQ